MSTPEQILANYQVASGAVRERVMQLAAQMWGTLGTYGDPGIERLIARLVPLVQAGQLQVATLTSAYLAAVLQAQGESFEPVPVDQQAITTARGVPADEVYRRPAIELYTALGQGRALEAAVALGARRLLSIVSTDLQMAKVRQAQASMGRSSAQYYRRVLNGGGNCAKCVITSTRRYRKEKLMPIHPGCDCGVRPLSKGEQPPILNQRLLVDTHEQVRQFAGDKFANASATDYQELIIDREHGEIGPVLTWRHQNFIGPADL